MKKIIGIVLIVGFLCVDFLFFHDVFKRGEIVSVAQYMTGALSLLVFAVSVQLLRTKGTRV